MRSETIETSPVSEWRGEFVKLRRKGAWSEFVFDERESGRLALAPDECGRTCATPLLSPPACPAALEAAAAAAAAAAAEAAEMAREELVPVPPKSASPSSMLLARRRAKRMRWLAEALWLIIMRDQYQ
jgi:hypothetical protein